MVVLITGGSKGIGRATALKFAENGYDIEAIQSRSVEPASLEPGFPQFISMGGRSF